jgi:hypothetical protein
VAKVYSIVNGFVIHLLLTTAVFRAKEYSRKSEFVILAYFVPYTATGENGLPSHYVLLIVEVDLKIVVDFVIILHRCMGDVFVKAQMLK